jgi:hypothetical protein
MSTSPNLPHQETEPRRRSRLCSFSYGAVWYDTCDASIRINDALPGSVLFGVQMRVWVSLGECGSHQL